MENVIPPIPNGGRQTSENKRKGDLMMLSKIVFSGLLAVVMFFPVVSLVCAGEYCGSYEAKRIIAIQCGHSRECTQCFATSERFGDYIIGWPLGYCEAVAEMKSFLMMGISCEKWLSRHDITGKPSERYPPIDCTGGRCFGKEDRIYMRDH